MDSLEHTGRTKHWKAMVAHLKKRNLLLCFLLLYLSLGLLAGCEPEDAENGTTAEAIAERNRVYEETISPNEAYVSSKEDVVHFTVKVSQNQNNQIQVRAEADTVFFEPLQYEWDYDREITEADIAVQWTTLMGNPEPTKEDQLAIAVVSVLEEGEAVGKWKISFANQGIEWIAEGLRQ